MKSLIFSFLLLFLFSTVSYAELKVGDDVFDLKSREILTLSLIDFKKSSYEGISANYYILVSGKVSDLEKLVTDNKEKSTKSRFLLIENGVLVAKYPVALTDNDIVVFASTITDDGYRKKWLYARNFTEVIWERDDLFGFKKGQRICTEDLPNRSFKTRAKVEHLFLNGMAEILIDRSYGLGEITERVLLPVEHIFNCR